MKLKNIHEKIIKENEKPNGPYCTTYKNQNKHETSVMLEVQIPR